MNVGHTDAGATMIMWWCWYTLNRWHTSWYRRPGLRTAVISPVDSVSRFMCSYDVGNFDYSNTCCAEWCTDKHFWRIVSGAYRDSQRDDTTNRRRFLNDITPLWRGYVTRLYIAVCLSLICRLQYFCNRARYGMELLGWRRLVRLLVFPDTAFPLLLNCRLLLAKFHDSAKYKRFGTH